MFKTIITAAAVSFLAISAAQAQQARQPNHCKGFDQAACPGSKACGWKQAETWTRKSDGKERVTKARCAYDAKQAKVILSAR